MRRLLSCLLFSLALPAAQAQDILLDNGPAQFTVTGEWAVSTAVAGYEGANYRTHAANGAPPGAVVVDNTDTGFGIVGDWPLSTAVGGYQGPNYQTHVANGDLPGSLVIDNTDANSTAVGTWNPSTAVGGYQGTNYATHAAGTGSASFTWTPAIAQAGDYQIYAKWTANPNRASNATYTVAHANGSTPVTVNQQTNGGQWNLLGTYTMAPGSAIRLTDQANGYVIADGVKLVPVGAPANTATWNATLPNSGDYQVYARWTAHPNRATNATYTISHATGNTAVTVNQQLNGGQWNLLGNYTFSGNASVKLTDQADGYVIADAVMFVPSGTGPNTATWTPQLTQSGDYQIYAKWTAHPNRATNATYTVSHATGNTPVTVNQQINGGQWNLLGSYTLAPGSSISLTDQANGYVIADAIKLVAANQSPTVSITSPQPNTSYTALASIHLEATAADTDGSITQVTLTQNGQLLTTLTVAPYAYDWINVQPGSYSITAQSTDDKGASTTSTPLQIEVITGIPQAYYIHTDQLNTPRLITDQSNTPVWRWDSDPFGSTMPDENPSGLGVFEFDLRFPGQVADKETGLFYNYYRDYDPATGRYPQSDPIGLAGGSFSTYAYVGGNPLNDIDPLGLATARSGEQMLIPPELTLNVGRAGGQIARDRRSEKNDPHVGSVCKRTTCDEPKPQRSCTASNPSGGTIYPKVGQHSLVNQGSKRCVCVEWEPHLVDSQGNPI